MLLFQEGSDWTVEELTRINACPYRAASQRLPWSKDRRNAREHRHREDPYSATSFSTTVAFPPECIPGSLRGRLRLPGFNATRYHALITALRVAAPVANLPVLLDKGPRDLFVCHHAYRLSRFLPSASNPLVVLPEWG